MKGKNEEHFIILISSVLFQICETQLQFEIYFEVQHILNGF